MLKKDSSFEHKGPCFAEVSRTNNGTILFWNININRNWSNRMKLRGELCGYQKYVLIRKTLLVSENFKRPSLGWHLEGSDLWIITRKSVFLGWNLNQTTINLFSFSGSQFWFAKRFELNPVRTYIQWKCLKTWSLFIKWRKHDCN